MDADQLRLRLRILDEALRQWESYEADQGLREAERAGVNPPGVSKRSIEEMRRRYRARLREMEEG